MKRKAKAKACPSAPKISSASQNATRGWEWEGGRYRGVEEEGEGGGIRGGGEEVRRRGGEEERR